MKFKTLMLVAGVSLLGLDAMAYNEPYAGAIVKKESNYSPKADFNPSNITDIMPSVGEKSKKEQEIFFSADEMETDEKEAMILASGNVVVVRGKLELVCDELRYNQKSDVIEASGNVKLTEEDGSVLYTDKITLSQKMTRAEVDKVKVIMRDESRIWADSFVKKTNENKQMKNASYTVCDMCEGKSPLWRIDARKVTHDAKGQNINYNNAVLRVKDVPVLYLPFLTHPAPEVKRRSGLLMASMGSSSYLGQYIQPTYFWDVSPHTDVILSPYFTTDKDEKVSICDIRKSFVVSTRSKHPVVSVLRENGLKKSLLF
jgi:LPS-assembly protein